MAVDITLEGPYVKFNNNIAGDDLGIIFIPFSLFLPTIKGTAFKLPPSALRIVKEVAFTDLNAGGATTWDEFWTKLVIIVRPGNEPLVTICETATETYVAYAAPGSAEADPVWGIKRLTETTSPDKVKTEWADGDKRFDNVLDDYLTLSYS